MSLAYLRIDLTRERVETGSLVVAVPASWTKEQRRKWLCDHEADMGKAVTGWNLSGWRGKAVMDDFVSAGDTDTPDLVVDCEGECRVPTEDERRRAPNAPPDDAWMEVDLRHARVPYRCDYCWQLIPPGERYARRRRGDVNDVTYAAHATCDAVATAYYSRLGVPAEQRWVVWGTLDAWARRSADVAGDLARMGAAWPAGEVERLTALLGGRTP